MTSPQSSALTISNHGLQANEDSAARRQRALQRLGDSRPSKRGSSKSLRSDFGAPRIEVHVRYVSDDHAWLVVDQRQVEVRTRHPRLSEVDVMVAASYATRFEWIPDALLRRVWVADKRNHVRLLFDASDTAAATIRQHLKFERDRRDFAWHSDGVMANFRPCTPERTAPPPNR